MFHRFILGDAINEVYRLKVRTDLHLARKAYHTFGVLIIVALYQALTREQGIMALGIAMAIVIPLDFLRLRVSKLNRLIFNLLGTFLRREEATRLSGMTHLFIGAFVIIVLFPKHVATLSFLYLAFGDPIASAIGVMYGKDKILPNKSLQGTLAAFVVCALISLVYFNVTGIMHERLVLVTVIGGVIGALSELVTLGKLDDNFTIPVLGASLLWLMFRFFGGFA